MQMKQDDTDFGAGTEYDYIFKVLLIGESDVGKSCLMKRFVDDQFKESNCSTIGVDFQCKRTNVDNHSVKLQIWDTAGQERYRAICASYYRRCEGILLVFDTTEPNSFQTVEKWVSDSQHMSSTKIPMVLVGSKVDLSRKRVIDFARAEALAIKLGIPYVETSSKSGHGVELAFHTLIHHMIAKREAADLNSECKRYVVPLQGEVQKPLKMAEDLSRVSVRARFSCTIL